MATIPAVFEQVRSLQEEMRLRQEAVRAAEAALTDRASSAESACRDAEKRRRAAEAAAAAADEGTHQLEGEVRDWIDGSVDPLRAGLSLGLILLSPSTPLPAPYLTIFPSAIAEVYINTDLSDH